MPTARPAYATPIHCVPIHRLTLNQAAAIAKRGRKLLRRGELTHREWCLLDCLLWTCRRPDSGAIVSSYTALQKLAHQARETVARGLRTLERVGLLSRTKRRLRVAWHQGGVRVRQLTNSYRLHPPSGVEHANHCEFDHATVQSDSLEYVHCDAGIESAKAARAALVAVAERRRPAVESKLLGKKVE